MRIKTCLPHPLPLKKLNWAKLIPLIGPAREALARYDELLKTAPPSALEILKWEESALSLRAFGLIADLDEIHSFIRNKDVSPERKVILQKILNAKKGLDFGIAWAKKGPLNQTFFCRLHAIIKQDAPDLKEVGRIRKKQNWIGPQGCTIDEAYFYPPASHKLKKYLQGLFRYANGKEKDPLVQAAIFFAQFLIIHPFMDGNGRVARIFIPLYLMKKKLLSKPCLFMSSYFAKHRLAYFQKLFHIPEKEGWENWISYFLEGITEQSNNIKLKLQYILK